MPFSSSRRANGFHRGTSGLGGGLVAGAGGCSQALLVACVFAGHSQCGGSILPKWVLKEGLAFSSRASGCNPSTSQDVSNIRQGGEYSFSSCFLRGTHRTRVTPVSLAKTLELQGIQEI